MEVQDVSKEIDKFRLHGIYCTKTSREFIFYGPSLLGTLKVTAIDQVFVCTGTISSKDLIEHAEDTGALLDLVGSCVTAIEEFPSEAILDIFMTNEARIRLSGRGPGEYFKIHLEKGGETIALIFG